MYKNIILGILIFVCLLIIISLLVVFLYHNKFINNFTDKKEDYHFVHISKNGGTSMERLHSLANFHFYNHDFNANMIESDKIYAVIRDPVSRFVSSFYFAKKGGFDPSASTFKNHPIHNFDNINDFIKALRTGDPIAKKALFAAQEGTDGDDANVVYWTQMFWLFSKNNKTLILMDFANLNENFKKLTGKDLTFTNTTNDIKKDSINDENTKYIRQLYEPDVRLYELVKKYQIFNTDTNFVKKLGKPDSLITPLRLQYEYLVA